MKHKYFKLILFVVISITILLTQSFCVAMDFRSDLFSEGGFLTVKQEVGTGRVFFEAG